LSREKPRELVFINLADIHLALCMQLVSSHLWASSIMYLQPPTSAAIIR